MIIYLCVCLCVHVFKYESVHSSAEYSECLIEECERVFVTQEFDSHRNNKCRECSVWMECLTHSTEQDECLSACDG